MSNLSVRSRPLALLSAVLLTLGVQAASPVQELNEGDHRALGTILKRYTDPKSDGKDKDKAREELVKALERIGKKRIEKDGDALQAALALTADLGRAIALAGEYKNVAGGKVTTQVIDLGDKQKLEYGLWLPQSYKPSAPVPLLLCFPGTENKKVVTPAEFLQKYWTEAAVRDGAMIAVLTLPDDSATWIKPEGGVTIAMRTFADLITRFAVDRDRVYLLGRGEGVRAALNLASMFPQRFAGVVGTAGDAGGVGHENFQNLPTFFQGGGAEATAFEGKNKEAGYNNCTVNAAATVTEMWSWIQSKPRIANPAKVTLAPGSPNPNKAYWIKIPATEGISGVITASADKATNTVTVQGTGVRSVTIFLNDALIDLSKPIKVVLNGREQTDVIPRSLDIFLQLYELGTCDAGMLYVASKVYDLPG